MKVLLGVGNPMRKDDGVGSYIARNFNKDGWITFDCGPTPENFVVKVEKLNAELIVIVDAANMGLEPGEFRKIPINKIDNFALSTHSIPLSVIINYLGEERCILIGIEPEIIDYGEGLSEKVKKSAIKIMEILEKEDFEKIPEL